jgi:NADH-quinone oxidoreductase subunit G
MSHSASVCSKCSVGCNVTLWQRRNELVRVTSHENDQIDDGWICDRGRFDYTHVNDPARLRVPAVDGLDATWESALTALLEGVKGRNLGISVPQDATNEELFLLSRLVAGPWRGARVAMEGRTLLPAPTGETLPIAGIESCKAVVVVASDVADDVPIVDLRVKKAVSKRGAHLVIVHERHLDLDRWPAAFHVRPEPGRAAEAVGRLAGHELLQEGPVAILYGDGRGTENVRELTAAVQELAKTVDGRLMPLYRGTNERGALAAGLALGEPDDLEGCDAVLCWGPPAAGRLPRSAEFVAVWDTLVRPEHGSPDVVIPDVSFAETQGSYTNLEGRVQFLRPVLFPEPPLREGWEVLSDIGERLGVREISTFAGIFQVQRAAAAAFAAFAPLADPPAPEPSPEPTLLGPARP